MQKINLAPKLHPEFSNEDVLNQMRRWVSIFQRCYNPLVSAFEHYGERGIRVEPEWFVFSNFLNDMGACPKGMSIGRIDNDGNYCKANCKWETQAEQNNNTRRSKYIEYQGRRQSVNDWAKEYDIGARRLCERLRRGWSIERALTTPCPKNYEQERQERLEDNKRNWLLYGHIYKARSSAKKSKPMTEQSRELLHEKTPKDYQEKKPFKDKNPRPARNKIKISVKQFQEIFSLNESGLNCREIESLTGIPKSTVFYWLKKHDT
tara:strand:+ start:561 stop:1349 length:789 start_codon:yes stop_codon:yes gene_type:complete